MIAETGKRLSLVVCRNPLLPQENEARKQRSAKSAERESSVGGKPRLTLPSGLSAIIARSSKASSPFKVRGSTGKGKGT